MDTVQVVYECKEFVHAMDTLACNGNAMGMIFNILYSLLGDAYLYMVDYFIILKLSQHHHYL